jgi:hypothetical protein
MLRGRKHGQHGGQITVGVALSSAEDALAVLPQDPEAPISTSVEPRGWIHPRGSDQVGGRHWAEKVLPEGGQGRLELRVYHSRGGMTMSLHGTQEAYSRAGGGSAY